MNSVELFTRASRAHPNRVAIWMPGKSAVSFSELLSLAGRVQTAARKTRIAPGDHVLLVDHLSPRLYAVISGLLALGACVVLVEPWMPIAEIERVISIVKPKLFITNTLGRIWGLRVPAVRNIPTWIHPRRFLKESDQGFHLEDLAPDTPGILTFTSGTTGKPKGVLRQQGYLLHQHRVLSRALALDAHPGPDLCIFANFALANLSSGRTSIIVPPSWRAKFLESVKDLRGELAPETLTCGPAFLMRLMEGGGLPSLKSIHVGGALTDCWIFEKAFSCFPQAHFTHIYGSSEAEPVATVDAREAVRLSRERDYFQTLFLGKPVDEISVSIEENGIWVAGDHVCPQYIGNDEENRLNKRADSKGQVWHFMGDRIRADKDGWWYAGRSSQNAKDFALEQKIYSSLSTSAAFVVGEHEGTAIYVERADLRVPKLQVMMSKQEELKAILEKSNFYNVEIRRDRRHRARIDRLASRKTGRPWQAG